MAGSDNEPVAENAPAVLTASLGHKVTTTPILVVGAGGIGCELLKNLVLSGFKKITVVGIREIYNYFDNEVIFSNFTQTNYLLIGIDIF